MAKKRLERKYDSRGTHVRLKGMDAKIAQVVKNNVRTDFPDFRAGDQVKVHVKIKEGEKERVQVYEGLVIARRGSGGSKSFNVRKISHGVGVERIFLETSPKIAKIEVVQTGKVRRAKLYYIRELEGKAAKIDREVETLAAHAMKETSQANDTSKPAKK